MLCLVAESFSCIQLFVTPHTVPHQAPLSMGILQARILEWVAMPSPRVSSQPRSPALQVDSLAAEPLGKPQISLDPSEPGGPVTDSVFHFKCSGKPSQVFKQ